MDRATKLLANFHKSEDYNKATEPANKDVAINLAFLYGCEAGMRQACDEVADALHSMLKRFTEQGPAR